MKPMRLLLLLASGMAALSCSAPSGNDREGPGTVHVRLQTPHAGDGAIKLTVAGPGITEVVPAGDLMAFSRLGSVAATIAVFGDLADGLVVSFDVPDLSKLGDYSVTLLQVAGPDNALRSSFAGYKVTVEY